MSTKPPSARAPDVSLKDALRAQFKAEDAVWKASLAGRPAEALPVDWVEVMATRAARIKQPEPEALETVDPLPRTGVAKHFRHWMQNGV